MACDVYESATTSIIVLDWDTNPKDPVLKLPYDGSKSVLKIGGRVALRYTWELYKVIHA